MTPKLDEIRDRYAAEMTALAERLWAELPKEAVGDPNLPADEQRLVALCVLHRLLTHMVFTTKDGAQPLIMGFLAQLEESGAGQVRVVIGKPGQTPPQTIH